MDSYLCLTDSDPKPFFKINFGSMVLIEQNLERRLQVKLNLLSRKTIAKVPCYTLFKNRKMY
jgi:hypothetical protein